MKLSIIVPVYNSSDILHKLHERILRVITKMNLVNNFELILINDFSKDNSWKSIETLARNSNHIVGINLVENFGQHNALMAGLNYAKGDYVITLDDDLQHPPESIPDIIDQLKSFDVCYTNYKNRQHVNWKKVVSYINNVVSSFLLNKSLKIYMSSFRGLKKNIVSEIIKFKEPDVYLDGLIIGSTKKIGIITVEHFTRYSGNSNYNLKKLLILWSNMLMNFRFFPFRLASIPGIVLKFIIKNFRKKNTKQQYKILEKI